MIDSADDLKGLDIDRLWQVANTLPEEEGAGQPNLLVTQIVALQEIRNQYAQGIEEKAMLDAQVDSLTQQLTPSSEVDKQLRILERDYDVKSDLYRDMLSRYEMAKLTGKLVRYEGPDKVKQIERAFSPTRPINSPISLIAIMGVVLGIFAGILFVFVAELLDSTVKDKVTAEKLINRPVLSILPVLNPIPSNTNLSSAGNAGITMSKSDSVSTRGNNA